MSRLTAHQLLLLNKVMGSKEFKAARDEVEAGEHHVEDFTVRVSGGVLKVSEDTTAAATARLLNEATLAFFIKRAGITREAAMEALREAALEAQNAENGVKKALLEETGVSETLKRVKAEVVSAMPRINKRGMVRVEAGVSLVESLPAPAPVVEASPEKDFTESEDDVDEFVMLINAK